MWKLSRAKTRSLLCVYAGFLRGCEDSGDGPARHQETQNLSGSGARVRGTPSGAFGVTSAGSMRQLNIKCQTLN